MSRQKNSVPTTNNAERTLGRALPGAALFARVTGDMVRLVWFLSGAFLAGTAIVVAYYSWIDYQSSIRAYRTDASYLAKHVTDHLSRAIGEVSLLLNTLRLDVETARQAPDEIPVDHVPRRLEALFFELPQLEAIAITNRAGDVVLSYGGWPVDIESVANRAAFGSLQHNTSLSLVIGEPLLRPQDGKWRLTVAHRISTADGKFDGMVLATLDPAFFYRFHESVVGPSGGMVSLLTVSEVPVLAMGHGELKGSDAATASGGLPLKTLSGQSGVKITKLPGQEGEFFLAYNQLPLGQLRGMVAVPVASASAAWWSRRKVDFHVGGAAAALLLLLTLLATRQIRKRQRAEETATMAREQLSEGIESLTEGFAVFDAEGRLLTHNAPFAELHLRETELLVGATIEDITRDGIDRGLYDIPAGEQSAWMQERLGRYRNPDGVKVLKLSGDRWLQISEQPTHNGGRIGVYTDVTERVRRERAISDARDAAEAASKAKSSFLAMISHELRTPLNAIIGFSEMMTTKAFGPLGNERYEEYAGDILGSGTHLLGVINDILDLTKAEAGMIEISSDPIWLPELLEKACRSMRQTADKAELEFTLAEPVPELTIEADERALHQVMLNLLSNAIKFTSAGGRVECGASVGGDGSVIISVTDTGIGIRPDDLENIFVPFAQADERLARAFEGTGLGLPLVKNLVELHGGHVEVDSTPGKGTTMRVSLPASIVLDKAA